MCYTVLDRDELKWSGSLGLKWMGMRRWSGTCKDYVIYE